MIDDNQDNIYEATILALPLGDYTIEFEAFETLSDPSTGEGNINNTFSTTVTIDDSSTIALNIWELDESSPQPKLPDTLIEPINLIGYTDNIAATITLESYDGEGTLLFDNNLQVNSDISSKLNSTTITKPSGISFVTKYPKGTYDIYIGKREAINIQPGDYIVFSNHGLDYFKRYKIQAIDRPSTIFTQANTKITLERDLEEDIIISENVRINIYNSEKPSGWFNFTNILLSEGPNFISIFAHKQDQAVSKLITINLDNTEPNVTLLSPEHNSVINDNKTQIEIKIEDPLSGVNISTINLSMSGACDDFEISGDNPYINYNKNTEILTFNIAQTTYCENGEYGEGIHNLHLEVKDNLGNKATEYWHFTVDTKIPSDPIILVENAQNTSLTEWYSNNSNSNKITMEFRDQNNHPEYIDVVSIYFEGDKTADLVTEAGNYKFSYTTGALSSRTYTFTVTARKSETNGRTFGSPKTWEIYLTIDDEAPTIEHITQNDTHVNSGNNLVNVIVETNEPSVCRWSITDEDFDSMSQASEFSSLGLNRYSTDILADQPLRYEYSIRCRDLAYNKMSESETVAITYDDTTPSLNITYPTSGKIFNVRDLPLIGYTDPGVTVKAIYQRTKEDMDSEDIGYPPTSEEIIIEYTFSQSEITISNHTNITFVNNDYTDYELVISGIGTIDLLGKETYMLPLPDLGTYSVSLKDKSSQFEQDTLTITVSPIDTNFTLDISLPILPVSRIELHKIDITAENIAGNQLTKTLDLLYDTVGPDLVAPQPKDTTVNDATPKINISITDASREINPDSITISIDGVEMLPENGTFNLPPIEGGEFIFIPNFNLSQGTYTVSIYAEDISGNPGSEDWSFIVDSEAPNQPIWTFCDGSSIAQNEYINYTQVCIEVEFDEQVKVIGPQLALDILFSTDNTTNMTFRANTTFLEDEHPLTFTISDLNGNDYNYSRILVVDTTAPEVITVTPENVIEDTGKYYTSDSVINFTYNAVDPGAKSSGIANCAVKVNDTVEPEPVASSKLDDPYITLSNYTFIGTENNKSYIASVVCRDKAGNVGTFIDSPLVKVDKEPPVVFNLTDEGRYTTIDEFIVYISIYEKETRLANCNYQSATDPEFTNIVTDVIIDRSLYGNYISSWEHHDISENGKEHFARVNCTDIVGNQGPYLTTDGILVDTEKPTFENLVSPRAGSIIGEQNPLIEASYSDAESGINTSSIKLFINGSKKQLGANAGETSLTYQPATDLAPGDYNITIILKDMAGNEERKEWVFQIDLSAPETPTFLPDDNAYINYNNPLVSITYAEPQIQFTEVWLGPIQILSTPTETTQFQYQLPSAEFPTGLEDGTYEIEVRAKKMDGLDWGAEGYSSSRFTVDTQAPTIDLAANVANTVLSSRTLPILFRCSEDTYASEGMDADIRFYVNGELLQELEFCDRGEQETSIIIPGNDGSKNITAIIRDRAGNVNQNEINVTLDQREPDIDIENVENDDIQFNQLPYLTNDYQIIINGTFENSGKGIKVLRKGEELPSSQAIITNTSSEFGIILILDGSLGEITENNISIVGTGENDRVSSSNITIYLDKKGPVISNFKPTATSIEQPNINISTDEEATCTINYTISSGREISSIMDSSDNLFHKKQVGRNLNYDYNQQEGVTSLVIIVCNDTFGTETKETFSLTVDLADPSITDIEPRHEINQLSDLITSAYNYKKYNVYEDNEITIRATTNEPTICKYSTSTQTYKNMENDFSSQTYSKTQSTGNIILPPDITYYIACQDKSGRTTETWTLELEYSNSATVTIWSISLSDYVVDSTPDLTFLTNKDADCYLSAGNIYLYDSRQGIIQNFDKTNNAGTYEQRATLTKSQSTLVGLDDRTDYSLTISCTGQGVSPNTAQVTFKTRYTGPELVDVNTEATSGLED